MTAQPLTRIERSARLILQVLTDERGRTPLDGVDWDLLVRVARYHTVLARVTARVIAMGGPVPHAVVTAGEEEQARGRAMLELLQHIHAASERHGIAWMAPKALHRFPDVGDDVDILVFRPDAATDQLLLEDLVVTRQPSSLTARVAGSTVYSIGDAPAPCLEVDIRHGRLGSAGQHAAFAKVLARNARPVLMGGMEFRVPSADDQLVLQGLEKVTGRRSFHLCDVVQTIQILRTPEFDCQYVAATARAHGGLDGLSCYLSYVDTVHRRLFGSELLSDELRRTFALGDWGRPELRERGFHFPALRVTGRIQGRQLGRALVKGDWGAARRLCLWPFAMIAARLGRSARRTRGDPGKPGAATADARRTVHLAGAEARGP